MYDDDVMQLYVCIFFYQKNKNIKSTFIQHCKSIKHANFLDG